MKAYFESPEAAARLEAAAAAWRGTPFRENSCLKGVGANCVGAIAGVLRTAGFPVPEYKSGPANWSRHQDHSLIESWIDSQTGFFMSLGERGTLELQRPTLWAGDVVGFKVGLCVHHLGVILRGGTFLQCSESMGTAILSQAEPLFRKRLVRAWRPVL